MSTIDPGMEGMLETFIAEGTSLLEELDEIMLESEKSRSMSEKNINEIFRVMHTIKGSAAMMGLEELSNFSHVVEDVFYIIRQTPSKLTCVMDTIFDLLFQASDYIKTELDIIQGSEDVHRDPAALLEQLRAQEAIMNGESAAPAVPTVNMAELIPARGPSVALPSVPEPAAKPTPPSFSPAVDELIQVRVFFDDGCQMVTIRAFMLLTQLQECCDVVISDPENPESNSDLAPQIMKDGLLIRFRPSEDLDEVLSSIANAISVKSYELLDSDDVSPLYPDAAPVAHGQVVMTPAATAATPAAGATDSKAAANAGPKVTKQNLINVNQIKLDQLMDLVGEIVTAESMVASNPDLKDLELDNFHKSTRELRKLTDELQDVVMSIRMVPLSSTFQKMNRIVRDMGKKLGKEVDLETLGGETEVDKTINDALGDPFMHMIRNSIDHGIESPEERLALGKPELGKVTIAAQNIGGEIVIAISDDGKGLDPKILLDKAKAKGLLVKAETEYTEKEIFGLIMLPGFSTNKEVTEFSGRGVGMDVVRKNIEKVGGSISIDSKLNVGSTFTIKIPLTLAIVDGMEISVGDTIFTLPITSIKQSFRLADPNQVIYNTDGSEMIMLRGNCHPIFRLHQMLGIKTSITDLMEGIIIHIEYGEKEGCIFADKLIGEQQVVVKPFPHFLNKYNVKSCGLAGCTILGDGNISLILDANNLLHYFER